GIEHVVMHADESGNDAIAVEVEDLGARGRISFGGGADRLNLPIRKHDGLVGYRCGTRAVNHADMLQCDHRRVYFDELFDLRRKVLCNCTLAPQHRKRDYYSLYHQFLPGGAWGL